MRMELLLKVHKKLYSFREISTLLDLPVQRKLRLLFSEKQKKGWKSPDREYPALSILWLYQQRIKLYRF